MVIKSTIRSSFSFVGLCVNDDYEGRGKKNQGTNKRRKKLTHQTRGTGVGQRIDDGDYGPHEKWTQLSQPVSIHRLLTHCAPCELVRH